MVGVSDGLRGQRVVCVGGASGMGFGVAEVARAAGATVVVTSRGEDKAAAAAARLGDGATGIALDLADPASVERFAADIGKVDHLTVTAGAVGRTHFETTPPAQARDFMDAKLWGTHALVWQLRSSLAQDGSICLITGGYAQWATVDAAHVHVAFAATEALARAVAVSLAPVRCNVLRPGFVDSALWDFMDDGERRALRAREADSTLIGRIVEPKDIGDAAVALMLTTAITGAVIPVDGGRHLRPIA